MEPWRVAGPVDVARLNSSVFLEVLRKFALVVALCAPFYFGSILLLARLRAPQLSIGFVLGHVWLHFVTAFVDHLALGLVAVVFATAVTSLFCWRHVLARGGPNLSLAMLAAVVVQLVRRLVRRIDIDLVAVVVRSAGANDTHPEPTILDQLCAALCCAPTAPPLRLALIVDRVVRIDQLTPRRIA